MELGLITGLTSARIQRRWIPAFEGMFCRVIAVEGSVLTATLVHFSLGCVQGLTSTAGGEGMQILSCRCLFGRHCFELGSLGAYVRVGEMGFFY